MAADAGVRAAALEKMSRVNEAYETLKDPWARRDYVLQAAELAPVESTWSISAETMELAEKWFETQERAQEGDASVLPEFHAQVLAWLVEIEQDASRLDARLDEGRAALGVWDRTALTKLAGIIKKRSYLASVRKDVERMAEKLNISLLAGNR